MRRHPFAPSALLTGLVLLGLAAVFLLDAAGEVSLTPAAAVPLTCAGLGLAALGSVASRMFRGRAARRSGQTAPSPAAPSGDHRVDGE
ncbi:hypothetical protein OG539_25570 [Actinacidiphila glaucinigra]|uniref:hypothetical protein n=1 Tax=Actinacidiphila glaucinigra TaxID=235986 RepID=UPI002DD9B1CF|nr:hypothetical protein [Actinacidiphila glaucinigra]WSD60559.1 hypothetical protein OIE69_17335 [Actinacidiphila glaucinigra]